MSTTAPTQPQTFIFLGHTNDTGVNLLQCTAAPHPCVAVGGAPGGRCVLRSLLCMGGVEAERLSPDQRGKLEGVRSSANIPQPTYRSPSWSVQARMHSDTRACRCAFLLCPRLRAAIHLARNSRAQPAATRCRLRRADGARPELSAARMGCCSPSAACRSRTTTSASPRRRTRTRMGAPPAAPWQQRQQQQP